MKTCALTLLALGIVASTRAVELNLMPWPSQITQLQGSVRMDRLPQFRVQCTDRRVRMAVARFSEQLKLRTGMLPFPGPDNSQGPLIAIQCTLPGLAVQSVTEDESYDLIVEANQVSVSAPNPLGILHGLETLLQLVRTGEHGWEISSVRIQDTPRFPWRGLLIDVSRHFIPLDVLKRNIDGMAAVKLNVLHLHLSDDEGFRVESKKRPKLHTVGSGGFYYQQSEIRELVLYGRDRGIRIVPEFDMPGHAVSWILAYPQLSSGPPASRLVQDMSDSVRPTIDPTKESTYKTIDAVFAEMTKLFPDKYFHIGGDEVEGKYWDQNEKIQLWMRAHKIKDNRELQAYFNKRLQKILLKYRKRMTGWDEILSPGLPQDTLVQSWRGPEALAQSAKLGYQTMLSAGWYLDLMYPASQHYAVEPLSGDSAHLTEEEKARVLGGEAAQWTEFVTPEVLDNRIWPRMGAIAERLWSPASLTDVTSMYARLAVLNANLEWLDLRHRTNSLRMLERIAGSAPLEAVEVLASTVEPLKGYERGKTQPYSVTTPLNRLVDAVAPESDVARKINLLAQQAVHDPVSRLELRKWLLRWRDNDALLQPYFSSSKFLAELSPLSRSLSVLGAIGIDSLDALDANRSLPEEKRAQQLASIDEATAPHAEVRIMIGPAIRQLVEAEPVTK
ncbi:MAG TPA: family 20 glycosylhydrolase [Candidatus Saccharimonadales bacterium]|nr:family 20 glycosylhydrolase [Candidatus Saccharimonadales bacterium]